MVGAEDVLGTTVVGQKMRFLGNQDESGGSQELFYDTVSRLGIFRFFPPFFKKNNNTKYVKT